MVYFIFALILGSFLYITKKREENITEEMMSILMSIRNKKQLDSVSEMFKEEYEDTIKNVIKQDLELENSIEELKEYREELEITYNSLLNKSSEVEYTNQLLEKRVENLSNLNSLSRAVLSTLDVEQIISVLFDAYFVMTQATRISLYLWENNNLINKKIKGNFKFRENIYFDDIDVKKLNSEQCKSLYEKISLKFEVTKNEIVMIYPLVVKGKELGVLFVIEQNKRRKELDEETISALVIQVSIAINNAQLYSELRIKERISNELTLAGKIQKKILPEDVKEVFGLEVTQYFKPAKEIGGDYYDYTILDENIFTVTIADVSGKGIPAAFLMALSRTALKTLVLTGKFFPCEDIKKLNQIIYSDIKEDMFITLLHSKYDRRTKTLYYSNAGHMPLVFYNAREDKMELRTIKGVALGFLKDYEYRQDSIKLEKGDIVAFYTDGITETENKNKEMYGVERLKETIFKNKEKSCEDIKEELLFSLNEFKGEYEQLDDLTFVLLKCME